MLPPLFCCCCFSRQFFNKEKSPAAVAVTQYFGWCSGGWSLLTAAFHNFAEFEACNFRSSNVLNSEYHAMPIFWFRFHISYVCLRVLHHSNWLFLSAIATAVVQCDSPVLLNFRGINEYRQRLKLCIHCSRRMFYGIFFIFLWSQNRRYFTFSPVATDVHDPAVSLPFLLKSRGVELENLIKNFQHFCSTLKVQHFKMLVLALRPQSVQHRELFTFKSSKMNGNYDLFVSVYYTSNSIFGWW